MTPGSCPYCGQPRPFSWVGGYHCSEDPRWRQLRSGQVSWGQAERGGRWPSGWPVS